MSSTTRSSSAPARRRTAVVAGVAAVALAAGILGAAAPAHAATYGTISAHRGGEWGPDNSMSAFKGALAAGIKDIEGDVYFTTDDVGVFSHDNLLGANCSPRLTITTSSWAAISGVRCSGEQPAKLADVMRAFKASPNTAAVLRVESKHPAGQATTTRQADARLLAQRVSEGGMAGRAIIQDFDWRNTAPAIHGFSSTMKVSCLEADVSTADVTTADGKRCYDVSYNHANWHDGLNARIHTAGMQVAVYTVNSSTTFRHFRDDLHANVIITDLPNAARSW